MKKVSVFTLVFCCWLRAAELTRYEFSEPHMGTTFRIVLYSDDAEKAKKAAAAAFAKAEALNQIMSDYKEDSELNQLCKKAVAAPVKVSDELFEILQKSQEVAQKSGGAFDITVGPYVRLWRRARRQHELPSDERMAKAREVVGFNKVKLNDKDKTVQLEKEGMQLDLGGIGKGYAADKLQEVLKANWITHALVAAGGDIAVSDAPPGTEGWTVAIAPLGQTVRAENAGAKEQPQTFLLLKNAGVSTSGDAEQFVEIGGKRYSHIIDPRSGQALIGRSSVTVVAPNATTSDGIDTGVDVLGPVEGMKLIEAIDGVAAIMVEGGEGAPKVYESTRWKEIKKKN